MEEGIPGVPFSLFFPPCTFPAVKSGFAPPPPLGLSPLLLLLLPFLFPGIPIFPAPFVSRCCPGVKNCRPRFPLFFNGSRTPSPSWSLLLFALSISADGHEVKTVFLEWFSHIVLPGPPTDARIPNSTVFSPVLVFQALLLSKKASFPLVEALSLFLYRGSPAMYPSLFLFVEIAFLKLSLVSLISRLFQPPTHCHGRLFFLRLQFITP